MCVYSINRILVQKQVTDPTKIIERNFNCGAWDSDMPQYQYVKIVPITTFINYVTTIDTATLDKPVWINYYP